MWKRLSFSYIRPYLASEQNNLSYKKINNFFLKNEVDVASDLNLKKIHSKTFKQYKLLITSLVISISSLKLVGPIIIHNLIAELDLVINHNKMWLIALLWGVLMVLAQVLYSFLGQLYIFKVNNICQSISKRMNQMIFRKILCSNSKASEGEVINRSIQDSENASNLLWISSELSLIVITILVSSLCLFYYLGSSVILPLIILFSIFPIGRLYAKRFGRIQNIIQKSKDDRLEIMSNYFSEISVIKSLGWEEAVFQKVKKPRKIEQFFWEKFIKLRSYSTINFLIINTIVASLAFGLYIFNGGVLTSELAFTCLCYFGFLEPALKQLSKLSGDMASVNTANDRIQSFLDNEINNSLSNSQNLYDAHSVAIVGSLGVGKSTLLNQFMESTVGKTIGYQPQTPYLFEATLIENLTFGKRVTSDKLNKALDLTGLNTDPVFADRGLRSQISEGGGNLNFAQKQKVVLARTYCLNPELLVLDEPCSSFERKGVDHIFNNLIFGEWRNKRKIIVTSQVKHLHNFEKIIFIDSNRQLHIGTLSELLSNPEFYKFSLENNQLIEESREAISPKFDQSDCEESDLEEIIENENVTPSLYLYYLRAMHAFKGKKRLLTSLALLFISALGVSFLPILQNMFITKWTDIGGGYKWALGYLGIGAILSILAGVQNFIWAIKTFKASMNIHDSVLTSVLNRYISFFDMYPGSNLLNVFSKNLDTLEKDLTFYLEDAFMSFLHTITSLVVLLVTLPVILIVLIPIAFTFSKTIGLYRKNLCRLKTLIAEARNPRIKSIKEALEGKKVISAFNAQRFFLARLNKGLDTYQDVICFQTVMSRWFIIRVSCMGSIISFSVAIYACYYGSLGGIGKGVASLMILYSFKFWENLCWSVKSVNEADSQMVFVGKFSNLTFESKVRDMPTIVDDTYDLVFENVVYASKNMNFYPIDSLNERISFGEKVGVYSLSNVSRSTFISLISGAKSITSGKIQYGHLDFVDDFNRSPYISFVSDKTDLFTGDVQSNLDPLHRKTTEEMRIVLEFVGLNVNLSQQVFPGGVNLSGGERRLICLARAILADTPVLVIEEICPGSVDLMFQAAVDKILEMSTKTVLFISDDPSRLSKCHRTFRIDHRIANYELPLAI